MFLDQGRFTQYPFSSAFLRFFFSMKTYALLRLHFYMSVSALSNVGVTRGSKGARPPPIKIPRVIKNYDKLAKRCLVAVFFSNYALTVINNNTNDDEKALK